MNDGNTSWFQSTPSGGKATSRRADIGDWWPRFNPRLPGGRRRGRRWRESCRTGFNPRLPGGRRHHTPDDQPRPETFQSTPSGGKATWCTRRQCHACPSFNPRLPGGRRPACNRPPRRRPGCFNPRLPGGRRLLRETTQPHIDRLFQSTPSGGKATSPKASKCTTTAVSIHAFRGEGDTIRAQTARRQ